MSQDSPKLDEEPDKVPTPPTLNYADAKTPDSQLALKLIFIATFANLWEASLARGKLEDAGIKAFIDNENMLAGSLYSNAIGGAKLRVPAIDAERALSILPNRVRARIIKCPKCGSIDTRQVDFSPGLKIFFLLLLGIPYLFVQRPWACLNCAHLWNASKDDEEYDPKESEYEEEDDDNDNELDKSP